MTSDFDTIRAAQALANGIIKAHNDAMTALAADVHPYSQAAVDAHEKTIRDNLAALLAAAHEAVDEQRELEAELGEANGERSLATVRAEAAEERVVALEGALMHIGRSDYWEGRTHVVEDWATMSWAAGYARGALAYARGALASPDQTEGT